MVNLKNFLVLILFATCSAANGQAFNKTFQGWWASTNWLFEFNADGTYQRKSSGHYGNTIVNGKYKINKDTVLLLTGFERTHGTVNKKYLLDHDTLLIDLNLRYDYLQITRPAQNLYSSKIRNVKYPQIQSKDNHKKEQLEKVLNLALNSEEINKYYHFKEFPDRKLVIEKYYYLDASITIGTLAATYKSKNEIKENFYIEFEDINLNDDSITIQLKLHEEEVTAWFHYANVDGKWTAQKPQVIKY